jgi:hypothetical protein
MADVRKPSITEAIARGSVVERDGKIDPKQSTNAAYLTTHKRQRKVGARQRANGKKTPRVRQKAAASDTGRKKTGRRSRKDDEGGGQLTFNGETWNEADLRKKVGDANKVEQELAIRRGELVERQAVKLIFSRVYQVIGSQVKTLSEKLGPDVSAAFGLTEDAVPRVQELMSTDILRALSGIKREFNAYLDSIGEEVLEDPA